MEDPDIGFTFLPDYEGKGYAFEASSQLMILAKKDYGLRELSTHTYETDATSIKWLECLKFSLNGTGKLPNNDEELLHYYKLIDFK